MQESDFEKLAAAYLKHLCDALEDSLGDAADIDLHDGILEIEIDDRSYVINKHNPQREIWLASPLSGAWHFRLTEDGQWRATKGEPGKEKAIFLNVLSQELERLLGRPIVIDFAQTGK